MKKKSPARVPSLVLLFVFDFSGRSALSTDSDTRENSRVNGTLIHTLINSIITAKTKWNSIRNANSGILWISEMRRKKNSMRFHYWQVRLYLLSCVHVLISMAFIRQFAVREQIYQNKRHWQCCRRCLPRSTDTSVSLFAVVILERGRWIELREPICNIFVWQSAVALEHIETESDEHRRLCRLAGELREAMHCCWCCRQRRPYVVEVRRTRT